MCAFRMIDLQSNACKSALSFPLPCYVVNKIAFAVVVVHRFVPLYGGPAVVRQCVCVAVFGAMRARALVGESQKSSRRP